MVRADCDGRERPTRVSLPGRRRRAGPASSLSFPRFSSRIPRSAARRATNPLPAGAAGTMDDTMAAGWSLRRSRQRTGPPAGTHTAVGAAWIRPGVVLVFLLLSLGATPVLGQPEALFKGVEETVETNMPLEDATLRSRLVTLDLGRMASARAAVVEGRAARGVEGPDADSRAAERRAEALLTLNLFDDTVVTGVVERTSPTFSGGYSVSGRLAGEALGRVTLVVNGDRVLGSVRRAGQTFRIRPAGTGVYEVSEIEPQPLECEVMDVRDLEEAQGIR